MSYGIASYIRYEKKEDLKKQLISFFKNYGFNISLPPEFDLLECDGFLPIVVQKDSEYWKKVKKTPDYDFITGFECFPSNEIDEYDMKIFNTLPPIDTDSENQLENYVILTEHYSDLFECCMNFIFSGALITIFHGVIEDPQIRKEPFSSDQIDELIRKLLKECRNEDFSDTQPFDGWE